MVTAKFSFQVGARIYKLRLKSGRPQYPHCDVSVPMQATGDRGTPPRAAAVIDLVEAVALRVVTSLVVAAAAARVEWEEWASKWRTRPGTDMEAATDEDVD